MTDLEEEPRDLSEVDRLRRWLAELTYMDIRQSESPQLPLRPDGHTFRGIRLSDRLYIGRDREFYWHRDDDTRSLYQIQWEDALHLMSFDAIKFAYDSAVAAANQRRHERRA